MIEPFTFWCPSCGLSHQVAVSDIGKTFWCPCGRVLAIGGMFATVIKPAEGAIVSIATTASRCFGCEEIVPVDQLQPTEIKAESWRRDNGHVETLPVVVSLCDGCRRQLSRQVEADRIRSRIRPSPFLPTGLP